MKQKSVSSFRNTPLFQVFKDLERKSGFWTPNWIIAPCRQPVACALRFARQSSRRLKNVYRHLIMNHSSPRFVNMTNDLQQETIGWFPVAGHLAARPAPQCVSTGPVSWAQQGARLGSRPARWAESKVQTRKPGVRCHGARCRLLISNPAYYQCELLGRCAVHGCRHPSLCENSTRHGCC